MTPTTNTALSATLVFAAQPSIQHQMIDSSKRITGKCDGLAAVKQTIYKTLNTERYAYAIYSWQYGVELSDLIGQSADYAIPEIERRIEDALTIDDRITGVDSFEFDRPAKNSVLASFTVHTIYGDTTEEVTVTI